MANERVLWVSKMCWKLNPLFVTVDMESASKSGVFGQEFCSGFCHESHEVMIPATTDPPRFIFLAVAVSKLRFRLRLRLHGVLHNMPSPMAVGKLLGTKVGLFRMITFLLPPRGLPHFSNGTKNGHSKWWNLLWLWGYGEKEVVVRSLSLLFLLPNSWNKVYRL